MQSKPENDAVAVWRTAAATYPTERALAQKAGLSLLDHPQQKTPPPLSQNAASFYKQMAAMGDGAGSAKVLYNFIGFREPTSAQIEQAQQACLRCAELRRTHQAVARPHCVFIRPKSSLQPELFILRSAVRLLLAESLVLAHQGKGPESVRNQALIFHIVRHAATPNTLISWLIARAIDSIALAGMARILTNHLKTLTCRPDTLGKYAHP